MLYARKILALSYLTRQKNSNHQKEGEGCAVFFSFFFYCSLSLTQSFSTLFCIVNSCALTEDDLIIPLTCYIADVVSKISFLFGCACFFIAPTFSVRHISRGCIHKVDTYIMRLHIFRLAI